MNRHITEANMQIRTLIIDDEQPAREILRGLLLSTGHNLLLDEASDANVGLTRIVEFEPDIVFLDVEMPGKNGLQLMDSLTSLHLKPIVILVTAYEKFAIEAFDRAAFGYLVKPVDPDKLNICLCRAISTLKGNYESGKLKLPVASGLIMIAPDEILHIVADGNYSYIHLLDGSQQTVTIQLGRLMCRLPSSSFMRVSRSSIINLKYLRSIDKKKLECTLSNSGKKVSVAISRESIKLLSQKES